MDRVTNRAYRAFWTCRGSFRKTWGLKTKALYWLYTMAIRPIITYTTTAWQQRVQHNTSRVKLNKLQRLACLGITGNIRTAPTAAIEVHLGLSSSFKDES
jgi:hypothetical protein